MDHIWVLQTFFVSLAEASLVTHNEGVAFEIKILKDWYTLSGPFGFSMKDGPLRYLKNQMSSYSNNTDNNEFLLSKSTKLKLTALLTMWYHEERVYHILIPTSHPSTCLLLPMKWELDYYWHISRKVFAAQLVQQRSRKWPRQEGGPQ